MSFMDFKYDPMEAAFYTAFAPVIWGFFLVWSVIMVEHNHAGMSYVLLFTPLSLVHWWSLMRADQKGQKECVDVWPKLSKIFDFNPYWLILYEHETDKNFWQLK